MKWKRSRKQHHNHASKIKVNQHHHQNHHQNQFKSSSSPLLKETNTSQYKDHYHHNEHSDSKNDCSPRSGTNTNESISSTYPDEEEDIDNESGLPHLNEDEDEQSFLNHLFHS